MVVASVYIWNHFVGAVSWDDKTKRSYFEYDPSFLRGKLDIAPLIMPLRQTEKSREVFSFPNLAFETYKGLPGLLADSLPDDFGNQLINTWLSRQGRNPESFSPVERLCYVGERGMGALEFKPSTATHSNESDKIELEELTRLASEILNEKSELKSQLNSENAEISGKNALKDILKVGTSAGGARAKAILAYNESTGEIRSGQLAANKGFTYWILKFDGVKSKTLGDPEGYGRIEYAYYQMAIDSGIKMMESRLLEENGRAHFMTKRFDRNENNQKEHMQTLCAIAHFDYNQPAHYSYEDAFRVMRELRLPYGDAEQLYRRMLFNIIARNQDDHTKNISFLMNKKGEWRLSPAYDMTYSYNPESYWTRQHQLSVNGKRDHFKKNDLLLLGKAMNIKTRNEIFQQISEVISNWQHYGKNTGVSNENINKISASHRLNIT